MSVGFTIGMCLVLIFFAVREYLEEDNRAALLAAFAAAITIGALFAYAGGPL